jgi:LysM repeat protein
MSSTHTVVAGDTLSEIAEQYRLAVEDLATWNDIEDPSHIVVGQKIVLSDPNAPTLDGQEYTVKPGDTFSAIGQRFGVDYQLIMDANGYDDPTKLMAGSTIFIPYRTHEVGQGDTFSAIARTYGVDHEEIMKLNGYEDPTKLPVGVTLTIPFS